MEFLIQLWLPIIVTAVVLFFASSIFWTVLPHHDRDFEKTPDEEALMNAIRELEIPPDTYIFPKICHSDHKNPEAMEKYKQGPRGMLVLWDMPNMGMNLGLTFLFFLLIATVTGYIAWEALGPGVGFLKVFQIVGAMGVLVHCSSGQLRNIWFRTRSLMEFFDGIAFGLLTGLVFALLWPAA